MEVSPQNYRARIWIITCYACVFLMVLIGGLTRLTESGLSIVEWKLVEGTFPPVSTEGWMQEFLSYQQTPQYQKVNHGMSLSDFQGIYWLEYLHRLMGRVTGLIFLVPLLYFALTQKVPGWVLKRMTLLTLLVGAQGFMGWYMVKSGLVHDPYVSPLRLAAHLFLAFAVAGGLTATWLRLKFDAGDPMFSRPVSPFTLILSIIVTGAVLLQVLMGALVAGYDAGLAYNTFPLMDGDWVPQGLMLLDPWYRNLFENTLTIQFQHRVSAFIVGALVVGQFLYLCRLYPRHILLFTSYWTLIITACQILIGIATLLYAVPTPLASLHQMTAFILFSFCAALNYLLYCYSKKEFGKISFRASKVSGCLPNAASSQLRAAL